MAKHTPSTPFGGHEAPSDTAMSLAFGEAMTCMHNFITAARDFEDIDTVRTRPTRPGRLKRSSPTSASRTL